MKSITDAYVKAINAANKALHDAGVTDRLIVELNFIKYAGEKTVFRSDKIEIIDSFRVECLDCASPGCYTFHCCANGPACKEPLA